MGVEFLHLAFLNVILDKQLIKMIGALWLATTEQYSRTFVPYSVPEWNSLPKEIVNASNIDIFKLKLNKVFIQNL